MKIGGLLKFSLIDYPGKIAAVIFTQGCNFRCPFCHNSELVLSELYGTLYSEQNILKLFNSRKGFLEGVVITGGEPTIQEGLADFLKEIKRSGFSVKLDTNGSNPDVLNNLITRKLIDYIAMDIKAPFDKYDTVTDSDVNIDDIRSSIGIIESSGLEYEFRTTVVQPFLNIKDLQTMGTYFKDKSRYKIVNFNAAEKIIDQNLLQEEQYSEEDISSFQNILRI
ncbi:MAG: anaerobic ribonucleoside-triphosphate reductase activating protein [Spirochaetes bacterium]|nr:anaerobic ribonucleoside-triphosphate reductase activating protein [Spirochaetota bacterium]